MFLDQDRADLDLPWYELRKRLSAWLTDRRRTSTDVLVLYHSGHGEIVADERYLLDPQSDLTTWPASRSQDTSQVLE